MRCRWTPLAVLLAPIVLVAAPTPGQPLPHHVSRTMGFTLSDGAVIGGDSVGIAWTPVEPAERYRFRMSRGPDLDTAHLLVDVELAVPRVMIGPGLEPGVYSYAVTTTSGGDWPAKMLPEVRRLEIATSACTWPRGMHPSITRLEEWLAEPVCPPNRPCHVIDEVEFKFQRKDSPLHCLNSGCDPTQWDRPHDYCTPVVLSNPSGGFRAGHPRNTALELCVGSRVSADCRKRFAHAAAGPHGNEHGTENCVRASVSMIASAYHVPGSRSCLSQDRIAHEIHKNDSPRDGAADLGHAVAAVNCTFPNPCMNECSVSLLWALGLAPSIPACNPVSAGPLKIITHDDHPTAFNPPVPHLTQLMAWLDDERPLMLRTRVPGRKPHMVVVVGYCLDRSSFDCPRPPCTLSPWFVIYDPLTGPRLERIGTRALEARFGGLWVAPPVSPQIHPRQDEVGVWTDSDNDGITDFDETRLADSTLAAAYAAQTGNPP